MIQSLQAYRATPRPLGELVAGWVAVPPGLTVTDLTLDSRAAIPGTLFLATRGRSHHGLAFAPEAVRLGARAVLYEPDDAQAAPQLPPEVFAAPLAELTSRAGMIADRFFGAPSQRITVAGITGTNGKTTCAWLLAQALQPCAGCLAVGAGDTGNRDPLRGRTEEAVSDHPGP